MSKHDDLNDGCFLNRTHGELNECTSMFSMMKEQTLQPEFYS